VFAYAVMKLCERGVLNLDTPFSQLALAQRAAENQLHPWREMVLLRRGLPLPAIHRDPAYRTHRPQNVRQIRGRLSGLCNRFCRVYGRQSSITVWNDLERIFLAGCTR